MHVDLFNKTIFITGGTGTLGGVFVRAALREGAKVWFTYFQNKAEAAALEKAGARGFLLDLSSSGGLEQIKEELKSSFGRLDVLINNAATARDGTCERLSANDWDHVLETDLSAVFHLTKTMLSLLYRSPQGKIVNVVSRAGLRGAYGAANYAAAKAGVIAFTKSLAMETGRKKILVNALNPGFMISGLTQNLPEKIKEMQKDASALGSFSDPKEVADFLIYMVSDRFRSVTGQVFHYDSRRT